MKKKGFTYVEIMISLAIFALMITFVIKMDRSTGGTMRLQKQQLQMTYVAQRMVENYKATLTDFESDDVDGFYVRVQGNSSPIMKTINGVYIPFNEVRVTVKKNKAAAEDSALIIQSRIIGE